MIMIFKEQEIFYTQFLGMLQSISMLNFTCLVNDSLVIVIKEISNTNWHSSHVHY